MRQVIWSDQNNKKQATYDLLLSMPPSRTLIFCNSKRGVDYLDDFLFNLGMPTTSIHSDRTQREREDALYVTVRLSLPLHTDIFAGVLSALANVQFSLLLLSPVVALTFAMSCMSSTTICLAWIIAALKNMFIALVCF
jgi:hypothetical protein